ncbi:hypothetical protein JX265_003536 [Neoarthrinium moseri]|uniref:FAD/NAD(P)-binding domain-containing protein n=1 Tax=Neoarthrinium moseri TaxID=1658444 RepID=A0A9P9WSD8_9PEZI|nr:uncharacterized protein JN550_002278 [Neoarthrinium moseri]KAI1854143.1 hypothetical protein JX266_001284 [Neoarthrinium moseri]KAI1874849.1 hypothetical protein JN550_002278 [Neoarthrinium moseri]KAI1877528.1 hypothetical protein JX265_003536 [Neoarthrinium moseri]
MTQTIVVLGGSYAGLQVAHRLVKNTRKTVKDLKVILVSKNSHFYWNLASVRAIIPGIVKDEEFSQPIEKGFAKYPSEAFEFIVGSAEASDLVAKTVTVSTAGGDRVLSYDHLVLATGTRTAGDDVVPWKASGTHEEIMDQIHKTAERVKTAKHIVVAGAGATGVEVAGEIRYEYKDKEVLLLSGDAHILGGDVTAGSAETELKKLGVTVQTGARVDRAVVLPDGKTEVTLQNGQTILTDLYLPTMGMAPNTEYLPSSVLKADKFVAIDEFYRVKDAANVWAAGDIVWTPRGGFVIADKQAAGVAKNIDLALHGKGPTPVKLLPMDVFVCAVGRGRGVGRMGSVKLFSYLVYMAKGKTLGMQMMPGILNGTNY